ncbi:hypothetical protein ACWEWU_14680 [Staphylococcus xylosus]
MDSWENQKRLLNRKEKEELGLYQFHPFFWEIDLLLISKSMMNIAYTIVYSTDISGENNKHITAFSSLINALKTELNLIKIPEDKDAYELFVNRSEAFYIVFLEHMQNKDFDKLVKCFKLLTISFEDLPVADFGDSTISTFLS